MTASPLVAGIEAIAAGHRAAGLSKRQQLRAMRAMYAEWDLAMQERLTALERAIARERSEEGAAWADVKSAESSERFERRKTV